MNRHESTVQPEQQNASPGRVLRDFGDAGVMAFVLVQGDDNEASYWKRVDEGGEGDRVSDPDRFDLPNPEQPELTSGDLAAAVEELRDFDYDLNQVIKNDKDVSEVLANMLNSWKHALYANDPVAALASVAQSLQAELPKLDVQAAQDTSKLIDSIEIATEKIREKSLADTINGATKQAVDEALDSILSEIKELRTTIERTSSHIRTLMQQLAEVGQREQNVSYITQIFEQMTSEPQFSQAAQLSGIQEEFKRLAAISKS